MTPHDIEQMRADREAGTPAPWSAFEDEVTGIKASDGRVAVCTQITLMHRRFGSEVAANARRIARVPTLEAEILRLREALGEARIDLMLCADNARDAAKTDPRWEGVAEKLMARVAECDKALNGDAP